jgi:crotonobetainyl-CoA:carnitine CoA-transferase CaiB-like acyl-CoA transferase
VTAPLEGLRVIDAANWLAAPAAAGLMADMGADVIKIEPPTGDTYRFVLRNQNPDGPVLAGWQNDNRGKRGVALDLDKPAAREVLLTLCEQADVLITNFIPSRVERYGLSYEAVRARNPRIIYTAFSGYGTRGPDANRLGFDFLAFWARSGIQSMIGDASAPPVSSLPGQGDHTTSLNILAAVLVALRLRDQTGEGQRVEVSLQQTGIWTLSNQVQSALIGEEAQPKHDRTAPANPIVNTYPTRDGRWVNLTMPQLGRDWPRFCAAIERTEWAEEFPDFDAVSEHAPELRERIEARFAEEDLAVWRERLDAADLLWAPDASIEEVVGDPQLREMDAFETVEHPKAGRIEMVSAPFHIDGADIRVRRSAPDVGEHTFEVLTEAGFSADEIATFGEQGAFG